MVRGGAIVEIWKWTIAECGSGEWPGHHDVLPIEVATYMYFINTSNASVPPGAPYMRLSIGDMSDARIDWRISMTAPRWTSYNVRQISLVSLPT
jgi:hypothetical protein